MVLGVIALALDRESNDKAHLYLSLFISLHVSLSFTFITRPLFELQQWFH
jgi:hypothetical protein